MPGEREPVVQFRDAFVTHVNDSDVTRSSVIGTLNRTLRQQFHPGREAPSQDSPGQSFSQQRPCMSRHSLARHQ